MGVHVAVKAMWNHWCSLSILESQSIYYGQGPENQIQLSPFCLHFIVGEIEAEREHAVYQVTHPVSDRLTSPRAKEGDA